MAVVSAQQPFGFLAGFSEIVLATLFSAKRRNRKHEQDIAQSNARTQAALEELQTEEMRVRRLVSDQLHGTLQNRMVLISAGIDAVARSLADSGDHERARQLTELADELDMLREREVRDLSHTLFPAGIELGAVRAIQVMIDRLPPQIDAKLVLGPHLQSRIGEGFPLMPLAERLIVVSTIEEAITNALKHGGATKIRVDLELEPAADGDGLLLLGAVTDDGQGFSGGMPSPGDGTTGLRRYGERLRKRGGFLRLHLSDGGGARLEFALQLPQEFTE